MTISVHEALNLPAMAYSQIVAGQNGVHNLIKWVTIVEVIEDIDRLQEGEFLITTGYGVDEDNQQFQKLLASNKLSAIAISTGFYLKDIPQRFIDIADAHDMPLIKIPSEINFSTITKGILEQIVNRQMEMITSSLNIHKQLTGLVLKQEGENKISETLSTLIEATVIVMNEYNEITFSPQGYESVDIKKERLLKHIHYCKRTNRPQQEDIEGYKVLFQPIIASETYYGCIIAVKELEKWAEIDLNAIEHAATVYAIEFLQKEAVEHSKIRLREEFLEEIINQSFKSSAIALERGEKLGYDLSLDQAVLHIKLTDYRDSEHLRKIVHALQSHITNFFQKQNRQIIMRNRLDNIIILFEVKTGRDRKAKEDVLSAAFTLLETWKQKYPHRRMVIGAGKMYNNINDLSQSAMEAKYAVDLSHLLLDSKEIIHFDDLGTFHLLLQMKEVGVNLHQFYDEQIGDLLKASEKGIDLLHTLETYFKHNLNMQTTAQNLFIHRHTLKYRLNKIEEKSGLNLRSADDRLKIQLGIAAYKIDQY
jgi:purine catabolism regulator